MPDIYAHTAKIVRNIYDRRIHTPAVLDAPDSVALMSLAGIAVPGVPVAGAATVNVGASVDTTVEVMPAPQPLFDGSLPLSPP